MLQSRAQERSRISAKSVTELSNRYAKEEGKEKNEADKIKFSSSFESELVVLERGVSSSRAELATISALTPDLGPLLSRLTDVRLVKSELGHESLGKLELGSLPLA